MDDSDSQKTGDDTAKFELLRNAVAARDSFLDVVAHELRNPMTPILVQVQSMRRQSASGMLDQEQLARALDKLEGHVLRYVRRATSLLDVSRARDGQIALRPLPVDLAKVTADVISSLSPAAQFLRTDVVFPQPSAVMGFADPAAVEQVVENLVGNAIKYGRGQPVEVALSATSETWTLEVRDKGPGLPAADQARLDEPFERAVGQTPGAGGFGIGLWLVKQIVDAMAGTIAFSRPPAGGSLFTVVVPWAQSQARGG